MSELAGKVAWVTGAGSGIGAAAARSLAAAGATVVLTGRRRAPLDAVAAEITAAGGVAAVEPADLTAHEAASRIVGATLARFGRLDILVNNAGLNVPARRWAELTSDGVDTVIGGNLSASFYCTLAALPPMRAQRGGIVIHTASWAARFISPVSGAAYTASKQGVVAMSHALNMEEFANGIRSTVLLPAEVATRPPSVCLNEIVVSPTWNEMLYPRRPADGVPQPEQPA